MTAKIPDVCDEMSTMKMYFYHLVNFSSVKSVELLSMLFDSLGVVLH